MRLRNFLLRITTACTGVLLVALAGGGCDQMRFGGPDYFVRTDHYLPATTPQNVIWNLVESHNRRDIDVYASLLASDFSFKFQPEDSIDIGKALLSRSEDSTGTSTLFRTFEVDSICVSLTITEPIALEETDPASGAVKIQTQAARLIVVERSGTTWESTSSQVFYLRPGRSLQHEDTGKWYIFQWIESGINDTEAKVGRHPTTWGRLKIKYVA